MSKSQDNSSAEGYSMITPDARFMAVWLSVMPVEQLSRQQLFAERERLEQTLAGYDRLIVAAQDGEPSIQFSLEHCRALNVDRLNCVNRRINHG